MDGQKTPLYDLHVQSNAQLVDFCGWQMPLHYGSQLQEHHSVRKQVGLFDVSHMGILDISGEQAVDFLAYVFANNIHKLQKNGMAIYGCLLNHDGGVIDDLLIYRLQDQLFRLVLNAGSFNKDLQWLQKQAQSYQVDLQVRHDLNMLALQGPRAEEFLTKINNIDADAAAGLKNFHAHLAGEVQISRTGYTGENGFEVIAPAQTVGEWWQKFLALGVKPCGLGARDTLRLEAGLNLYGTDMDETTSPWVSNLGWTVSVKDDRDFIGRQALLAEKSAGISQRLVGLLMREKGVLRNGQQVLTDCGEGVITSGGFSPTLGCAIALARLPIEAKLNAQVIRRAQEISVVIRKPPFVRCGREVVSQ